MPLQFAKLTCRQSLQRLYRLFLLQIWLAIQICRLHVTLVIVGPQNDHVCWNELIAQNFDNLTYFEILPDSRSENALIWFSPQDQSPIFLLILLLPLFIFEKILEGRNGHYDEESVRDGWLSVRVRHSRDHLKEKTNKIHSYYTSGKS